MSVQFNELARRWSRSLSLALSDCSQVNLQQNAMHEPRLIPDDEPMVTTFHIPRVLQPSCDGKSELCLRGRTIRAVLKELQHDYPALYVCLCDETGAVRRHLNIFVNNEIIIARDGLDTPLKAGDLVSVFQAVSGG